MNCLVLLTATLQVVLLNGAASSYFVRMPYPNPAGVTYSGISPYETVAPQTAVSSPATPLASARSLVVTPNPKYSPNVQRPSDWQPEINYDKSVSIFNETTCGYGECEKKALVEKEKLKFFKLKRQGRYNKLETRITGIQKDAPLLDLNYPICYTLVPVGNTIITPLTDVSPLGFQPTIIHDAPFGGLQVSNGAILFTPQNPPFPLLPPFQVSDFLPQAPGISFLPPQTPQIPFYPSLTMPAPPVNLPNGESDDTDSVVVENPELEGAFKIRNVNDAGLQTSTGQQKSPGSYEKQVLEEFSQRQVLRGLKMSPTIM